MGVGMIIAIGLLIFFFASPFLILARVTGIAREIREIKMKLKEQKNSNAIPLVTQKVEAVPNVACKPKPATRPVVPPHVPAVITPKKELQQEPEPAPMPKPVPIPEPVHLPEPAPEPVNPRVSPAAPEMSAGDIFWAKFGDWFCVRGDFAPKGTTREFAIATRWLTRVGAMLLVGAIAYFLMLAIDKGWVGPVQRVYGMMAWGVIGTAFGMWLKLKSERYAILGEVGAAVGLVALYLSFGLGHRYFEPPVIVSGYVAFAGLFATTIAAGALSVRLKSFMIAGLALVGGFLVPSICNFTDHDVQLHIYLSLLSLGACGVACLRRWPLYAFAAIAVSLVFSQAKCGSYDTCDATVAYIFQALEFALTVVVAIRASVDASIRVENTKFQPVYWIPVVLAGIFCLFKMDVLVSNHCAWRGASVLNHFGWSIAFAALASFSRRRVWGGTPVFVVFSCVCGAFALATACIDWWYLNNATCMLLFCLFAALLVELGARSEEYTLQVIGFITTVVVSVVGFGLFVASVETVGGYAHDLVDRMQYLWPLPALVAFTGWRLGDRAFGAGWLRKWSFGIASGMSFVIVTKESQFFGHEFLPALRGGFVTIVWAIVASVLLAVGIVRRVKVARLMGLGVLALSVAKLLFVDTASLATPGRVGVFAAVGVLMIVGAFLYLRFKAVFEEAGTEARHPDVGDYASL